MSLEKDEDVDDKAFRIFLVRKTADRIRGIAIVIFARGGLYSMSGSLRVVILLG